MPTPEISTEKPKNLRVLTFVSDIGGCHRMRVHQPFVELRRFGVENTTLTFLPNMPGEDNLHTLIKVFSDFDIVIVQRCYLYHIVKQIKDACEFIGIPCVFETDDDYLHLDPQNPAYASILHPSVFQTLIGEDGQLRPGVSGEQFIQARREALEGYKEIIRMMDAVTVSTEELKQTLLPYNKNIHVFENCVLNVYPWRTWDAAESMMGPDGTIQIKNNQGMVSVPAFYINKEKNQLVQTPRIGYTCTPSHRGKDWDTIAEQWERLIKKHSKHNWWFVYIGADPGELGNFTGDRANGIPPRDYWIQRHMNVCLANKLPWRVVPIAPAEYDLYNYHIRNIDVGIAPLHMDGIFNMSKSDIKIKEYAAWQVPAVAPNHITYNRNFTHGENVLLYNNARQFSEYVELLANDPKLRADMGRKAMELVKTNFLEKDMAAKRFRFLKTMVDSSYKLQVFRPNV